MTAPRRPEPLRRAAPAAVLPAAVSTLVADTVHGPVRSTTVLGVFPTAVYLGAQDHDEVIAVLAHDALDLPIGVRVGLDADALAWDVRPGDLARVGDGSVHLGSLELRAARTRRPAQVHAPLWPAAGDRPHPHREPADAPGSGAAYERVTSVVRTVAATGTPLSDSLLDATRRLATAAVHGAAPTELAPHVLDLVGAGPGLTPSGDDALCGVLLMLRATGHPSPTAAIAAALEPFLPRTTSISAALLRTATDGHGTPEVVRLVDALAHATEDARDLVGPVLAIGHSSGRDLLAGALGALTAHLTTTRPLPDPEEPIHV